MLENKLQIVISPQKLRYHRKSKDINQQKMADLMGVERTTYVGYEKREELEVASNVAEAVAEYLGVKVDDLKKQQNVNTIQPSSSESRQEYINIHREVWQELRNNNQTYKESLDKLIQVVDRTMENLSNPANRKS